MSRCPRDRSVRRGVREILYTGDTCDDENLYMPRRYMVAQ